MTTLEGIMQKASSAYRFHGVRSETLARLVEQSENRTIALWGRDEDEDGDAFYLQGVGELSATMWKDVDMSCNEFVDAGGLLFVLEPVVTEPQEREHDTDRRECLLHVEEWRVVGGLRPVFDEDEEIVEFAAFSVDEILAL